MDESRRCLMVTSRTVAAVMRAMAVKQSAHLRRETPMVDQFLAKYAPFIEDAAERAAKTFAQGFLAAAGVASAASDFHSVPWVHAGQVGVVAVVFSFLTSLASLPAGTTGTASLTKAVQKSPRRKSA